MGGADPAPASGLAGAVRNEGEGAQGEAGEGRNITHQQKKLERADLIAFRNRFELPLSDEQAAELAFYKPAGDSAELAYCAPRPSRSCAS